MNVRDLKNIIQSIPDTKEVLFEYFDSNGYNFFEKDFLVSTDELTITFTANDTTMSYNELKEARKIAKKINKSTDKKFD